jgi:hypothetical protein
VLILQAEKVPDESAEIQINSNLTRLTEIRRANSPKQFTGCKECHNDVRRDVSNFCERERDGPSVSQYKVLNYSKVVVGLVIVHNFLSEVLVLSAVGVKETPVHFDVPVVGIDGGDEGGDDPQIEEGVTVPGLTWMPG